MASAAEVIDAQVVLRPHPGPQTAFLASEAFMVLYGGAGGGGKAARLDEPVPTPTGWTTQGALKVGDLVLDELGRPTRVTHVHPIEPDPDARRVTFDDGATIEVSAEHLWLTFNTIERLAQRGLPAGCVRQTDAIQATLRNRRGAPNHAVLAAGDAGYVARPHGRWAYAAATMRWRYIVSVEPCAPSPMRCITVENPTGLYQIGRTRIVTHNSWALIYAAALHAVRTPGWNGLICRNKAVDLMKPGGLWDRAMEIARMTGGEARGGSYRDIRWPGGGRLAFDYVAKGNYQNYRSTELAYLGIDEVNECPIEAVVFLMSRLRTTCGARPIMRLTCNPDPTHEISKWVDPHYLIDGGPEDGCPDRSQSGRIRYFARRKADDEFVFGDTAEACAEEADREIWEVKSFTFIDALLKDNPTLAGDETKRREYLANIAQQGAVVEEQLRKGNWRATEMPSGIMRPELWGGGERFLEPVAPIVKRVRAWDLASTKPRRGKKDPDYTVGVLMAWDAHGRWYIEDVVLCREEVDGVDDLLAETASADGTDVLQVIEVEGGASGKRDAKTTAAVLRSGGNCGTILEVRAIKDKPTKARALVNELRLGMVGNRPRTTRDDKGPISPRGFLLNANGWMTRAYSDTGNALPTVGKIFWQQVRPFPDPEDKEHDDIPDAMAIAHNAGRPQTVKAPRLASRWDRLT